MRLLELNKLHIGRCAGPGILLPSDNSAGEDLCAAPTFDANAGSSVSLKEERSVLPSVCRLWFCLIHWIDFPWGPLQTSGGKLGHHSELKHCFMGFYGMWRPKQRMCRASILPSATAVCSLGHALSSSTGALRVVQDLAQGRPNRGNEGEQVLLRQFPHIPPASFGFEPATLWLRACIISTNHNHNPCPLWTSSDLVEIKTKHCHLVWF